MNQCHQKRIQDFMNMIGQDTPTTPQVPDQPTRKLRASLILEEALETIKALGFSVKLSDGQRVDDGDYHFIEVQKPDLTEIADGVADISVVAIGTSLACGIDINPVIEEVDQNNLEKFTIPGGYRRPDGKWVKSPSHEPPKIKEIIDGQKISDNC